MESNKRLIRIYAPRAEIFYVSWIEPVPMPSAIEHRMSYVMSDLPSMGDFATKCLPAEPDEIAPDGSAVRLLLGWPGGTVAHFELQAGETSRAITHRTVEEVWFILAGRGELWRKRASREEIVALEPGVCVTLPHGTHFQFRAAPSEGVAIIAVTIPRWPGDQEAEFVEGPWACSAP